MNALQYQVSLGKLQQPTCSDIEPTFGVWGLRAPPSAKRIQSTEQSDWAIHDKLPTDLAPCKAWKTCHETTRRHFSKVLSALLAALTLTLAACGGGGGGGGGGDSPTPPVSPSPPVTPIPPAPPSTEASDVLPSCTGCGAVSNNTYSGSGVGIWDRHNTAATPQDVVVSIAGLVNKTVTLIVTNELSGSQPLSTTINPLSDWVGPLAPTGTGNVAVATAGTPTLTPLSDVVPTVYTVGSVRSFLLKDSTTRLTTLQKQLTASDGMVVNVWVETAEVGPTKMTTALIDQMGAVFAGPGRVYDMLVQVNGPLWGPHPETNSLPASGVPIDLVFVNLTKDGLAFGQVAYFFGLNNYTKTAMPTSNESLALFLDTETLYLGGEGGMRDVETALAHEGQHMSNFYHRQVLMGNEYAFSSWLEEMSAMMMEEAASGVLVSGYSEARDNRFPPYLSNATYTCALLSFASAPGCDGYSLGGMFGAFLLRQMGVGLLQNLVRQPLTDSQAALEAAIQSVRASSGIGLELRKFAVASIAPIPAAQAPAGFDFPARTDGSFVLVSIDAQQFFRGANVPTASATLNGYASTAAMHKAFTGTFRETVRVSVGSTLSVVVN